ncbi:hypothetical protein J437_LFUL003471 [Ladona fulva]|uniref:Nuclear receptor 2C2-associated protein n=1 Tax=Ladona fulva TaxID=123851 RepID=A0A8K0JSE6_LADFU|nr:hypothetical protein J437_LFUL003471 [Ladona fulva]
MPGLLASPCRIPDCDAMFLITEQRKYKTHNPHSSLKVMSLIDSNKFQCRVSSVLNKDVKSYGKKHLFDGNEDSCWNSDQGTPQWIAIEFTDIIKVESYRIQFQGGFVGTNCVLKITDDCGSTHIENFYPEDVNSVQNFSLKEPRLAKSLKFVFNSSTDFFGRIVVYKLEIIESKR